MAHPLAETIARLSRQGRFAPGDGTGRGTRLRDLPPFGTNPGGLQGRYHVPDGLADGAPLVVVLHGCGQTAEGYDIGSGWSQLADRHGIALLFPEQQRQNNPNACFNWFSPEDGRRGQGEALSIRQMIEAMATAHAIDRARIFVTGLSAGGAMASIMLATYPEVFAGGAIIAGLPYGTASTIPQALERMRGQGGPAEAALTALVRGASDHAGPWPTLSIWHGSADATVHPANADAIVAQWRTLHAVNAAPDRVETVAGYPRRVWCDVAGREVIEAYSITGMGHGTPLDPSQPDGCGRAGPFMLDARICSTERICRFWGLADSRAVTSPVDRDAIGAAQSGREAATHVVASQPPTRPVVPLRPTGVSRPRPAEGVGKVIEDALRAAGLMR